VLNLAPDYSTGVPLIRGHMKKKIGVNSFSLVGLPTNGQILYYSNHYQVAQGCIERCPYESATLAIYQENVASRERERSGLEVEK
jgi:hypothetical protein